MIRPYVRWLWERWRGADVPPPVGWVRLGSLRRVTPISREFGYDRGQPVDRYYIERFLAVYAVDIRGHVLEIADDTYTRRFGGERVARSDVLHATDDNAAATIVGDLTRADHIPSDTYDCVVLTQTLQMIYDVPAALRTVLRILRPGGVALITVPGISQVSQYDLEHWGWYWSFSSLAVRRHVSEVCPSAEATIDTHGNVLAAAAFLYGLAAQELASAELDARDPDYQLVITARVVKPGGGC